MTEPGKRVPVVGLAAYDGDGRGGGDSDRLANYPHTDRTDDARTIEDCLAALEGE
ncbi:MAG: hypothetical protein QXG03_09765 [Halalkalicoccus sp.]